MSIPFYQYKYITGPKEPIDRAALINFQNVSAAGIVVLLVILLTFNAVAILIRQYTQKPMT